MTRALARIDLGAVQRNCARLKEELGEAELCAVVKADGYGHGADACADAALKGGATRLAVATATEAERIGRGFPHVPLLTMGALTPEELDLALAAGSEVTVWSRGFLELLVERARAQGRVARVHVKYDSGMGRLGNRDPSEVMGLARACSEAPELELAGIWTHFATADEPDSPFFDEQLDRFEAVVGAVRSEFPSVIAHAANSAAVLRDRPSPGALAALLRGRCEALRGRRQRRVRADLESHRRDLRRGTAPRLRRRGASRSLQQRRGAGPRQAPPSRWHGLDGQRDD
jgi:alanine racemase